MLGTAEFTIFSLETVDMKKVSNENVKQHIMNRKGVIQVVIGARCVL